MKSLRWRAPGRKTLATTLSWLRSRSGSHALILGYHRVADEDWDPFSLSVRPECFAEQMQVVADEAHPIAVREIASGIQSGTLPKRAVAVTFDDGYVEVARIVKPLLEKLEIPATVFVPSGLLGREPWWDEVARIVRTAARLPVAENLTADPSDWRWLHREGPDDARAPSEMLRPLMKVLRKMSSSARKTLLRQLWEETGAADTGVRHRCLTADELVDLSAGSLMDVGGHSVNHAVLPEMSPSEQAVEIRQCKSDLESVLQTAIAGFAYPNGLFSKDTVSLVESCGFEFACASGGGVVDRRSERLCLPRFWAPDRAGKRFRSWLRRWQ